MHMGLPMLIKQRLAPACMNAYADVISLGSDLRYPKTVRYIIPKLCWNINCTDLPSLVKFPFSLHEMVAGNGCSLYQYRFALCILIMHAVRT